MLGTALGNELVLLRPRSATGSLDAAPYSYPNHPYDESKIADLVPADSYDFTGLSPVTDSTTQGYQWHYIRPNDPAKQKAWHFVYPGHYNSNPKPSQADPNMPMPRQGGTVATAFQPGPSTDLSQTAPYQFGSLTSASLDSSTFVDAPVQLNNTDFGGPNKTKTAFPFGGFARNGDILQVPFIGGYRVQYQGRSLEFNSPTMDAAFADDTANINHTGENIGRFCMLHPADNAVATGNTKSYDDLNVGGIRSPYYFSRRLFDFLSVHAPSYDFLPNLDPSTLQNAGALGQPIANANPSVQNANTPAQTEDNVGTEGLININTASWRVLATLPMVDDPTANQNLAKAIVAYRDGDAVNGITPHGPFTNIFELLGVPAYSGSGATPFRNTLGQYKSGNFDPATTDPGNADGDLSPYNANSGTTDQVVGDFESQFLALNRISNLITTRSDSFTVYLQVQGWRGAGTTSPELVVQRRAAFLADRSGMTPTNKTLVTTNVPTN